MDFLVQLDESFISSICCNTIAKLWNLMESIRVQNFGISLSFSSIDSVSWQIIIDLIEILTDLEYHHLFFVYTYYTKVFMS
jgi:hypothetical protein